MSTISEIVTEPVIVKVPYEPTIKLASIKNGNGNAIEHMLSFRNSENANDFFHTIYIYPSPTSNCQIFSIGAFNALLSSEKKNWKPILEEVKKHNWGKRMLLIDIHDKLPYKTAILELFGAENIIVETPYKSTRGTAMILYLIIFSIQPDERI